MVRFFIKHDLVLKCLAISILLQVKARNKKASSHCSPIRFDFQIQMLAMTLPVEIWQVMKLVQTTFEKDF